MELTSLALAPRDQLVASWARQTAAALLLKVGPQLIAEPLGGRDGA